MDSSEAPVGRPGSRDLVPDPSPGRRAFFPTATDGRRLWLTEHAWLTGTGPTVAVCAVMAVAALANGSIFAAVALSTFGALLMGFGVALQRILEHTLEEATEASVAETPAGAHLALRDPAGRAPRFGMLAFACAGMLVLLGDTIAMPLVALALAGSGLAAWWHRGLRVTVTGAGLQVEDRLRTVELPWNDLLVCERVLPARDRSGRRQTMLLLTSRSRALRPVVIGRSPATRALRRQIAAHVPAERFLSAVVEVAGALPPGSVDTE